MTAETVSHGSQMKVSHLFSRVPGLARLKIGDTIKQIESEDVRNINLELLAYRGDKFLCFSLFLNCKECFLQPDVPFRWGLDQKVVF